MKNNVLYLMVVNKSTEAEIAAAYEATGGALAQNSPSTPAAYGSRDRYTSKEEYQYGRNDWGDQTQFDTAPYSGSDSSAAMAASSAYQGYQREQEFGYVASAPPPSYNEAEEYR